VVTDDLAASRHDGFLQARRHHSLAGWMGVVRRQQARLEIEISPSSPQPVTSTVDSLGHFCKTAKRYYSHLHVCLFTGSDVTTRFQCADFNAIQHWEFLAK
jgi:hypothetical protein